MTDNPFEMALEAALAQEAAAPARDRKPEPEGPARPGPKLITEPGAYAGIDDRDYHGVEICDAPSISASGLKLIEAKSPAHYYEQSPLNPNRKPRIEKKHFAIGHAIHDLLLLEGKCPADYHIVPDDFTPAHNRKWADYLPDWRAAVKAGKTILDQSQFDLVQAMAESVSHHELAGALLSAGEPEMTLAAKDPKTGRWLRARPDVLPTTMEIIPDVKTAVDASPDAFERAATKFGYFESAAHYLDVLELLYGETKRRFVNIVIEKERPHPVVIYHLDDGDIHYGRMLNRQALNLFDHCLKTGVWHGYSTPDKPILPLQMAHYKRQKIDRAIERGELSWDL